MTQSDSILRIRVSRDEWTLLDAAARSARVPIGDFVRTKALAGAEAGMLQRSAVTIPAIGRDKFQAWIDRPAKEAPALRDLASRPPIWQDCRTAPD